MYYNKVVLVGTVGKKPQFTGQNNEKAVFPLEQKKAWSHRRTGKRHEEVQYHRIEVSGSVLKSALSILFKDAVVLVEGKLISKTVDSAVGNDGMKSFTFESEVSATLIKKMHK